MPILHKTVKLLTALLFLLVGGCGESNSPSESQSEAFPISKKEQEAEQLRHDYVLKVGGITHVDENTPSVYAWAKSLSENLRHKGEIHIFTTANHQPLQSNGFPAGKSFLKTEAEQWVLVEQSNGLFVLIDFEKKIVGTMGTGGASLHPHPNGEAFVLLNPKGNYVLGVHLGDEDKTGEHPPIFIRDTVLWTWGERE